MIVPSVHQGPPQPMTACRVEPLAGRCALAPGDVIDALEFFVGLIHIQILRYDSQIRLPLLP